MNQAAHAFWHWLAAYTPQIQSSFGDPAMTQEIARRFDQAYPGLQFEIAKGAPWKFCISAEGRLAKFPDVELAVAWAPAIPGWQVVAFRQRGKPDTAVTIGPVDLAARMVCCTVRPEQTGGVHLVMWISGIPLHPRESAQAAFILLDNAVGEYDAAVKIRSVDFEELGPIPPPGGFSLVYLPGFLDTVPDPRRRG